MFDATVKIIVTTIREQLNKNSDLYAKHYLSELVSVMETKFSSFP